MGGFSFSFFFSVQDNSDNNNDNNDPKKKSSDDDDDDDKNNNSKKKKYRLQSWESKYQNPNFIKYVMRFYKFDIKRIPNQIGFSVI